MSLPFFVRDRCLASFRSSSCYSSYTQQQVAAAIAQLGVIVNEEVNSEGYWIDMFVLWKGTWIAVEVDGPMHFFVGPMSRLPKGSTLLKRRQLRALGWRIAVVPYWEWYALGTDAERREYVVDLFEFKDGLTIVENPVSEAPRESRLGLGNIG